MGDSLPFENTQRILPAEVSSLAGVLGSLLDESEMPETGDPGMLVATNRIKCSGAGVIFNDDVLSQLTDKLGDRIFILPSSVHEIIALADDGNADADVLKNMVRDVNRTQVRDEEFLSDNVYSLKISGLMWNVWMYCPADT